MNFDTHEKGPLRALDRFLFVLKLMPHIQREGQAPGFLRATLELVEVVTVIKAIAAEVFHPLHTEAVLLGQRLSGHGHGTEHQLF